ncbi:TonB-dependent receptor [Salegentibacter sediminis]|uniref:TonB-dependent receptor n=1 Tax=Salegentibacter sediminis TaxID=1930251 RepID=UPI0009BD114D|nr:TonB-dependent receptor [Salegentibacter sediminis]
MKEIFILILLLCGSKATAQTISGKVQDRSDKPIAFANIYLEGEERGTTSGKNGKYILKIIEQESKLVVSALGYQTVKKEISISEDQVINITLEESKDQLEEILIVDTQTGLTRKTPYNVSTISMQGIENKGNPNGMMGSLRELPGLYGAEFGQGIIKPFIRGLGFSRIVTIYQGNKLENHQWGADHGLGINDLGVKRVEVVKGPASVLYGSGALGGVLLVKDEDDFMNSEKITGSIGSTYNSVSRGIRTYASAGRSFKNDLFFAADMAIEKHADYQNGNQRIIGNSRFNSKSLRLHSGWKKENFENKLAFTYNDQNLGIIHDQEMLVAESLATTRNDRKMQLPFQEVTDYLFSYNQETKNENYETSFHLSHHFNERREIESARELIDLGLKQNHTFFNARLSLSKQKVNHSFGVQGSFVKTRNFEDSEDFLIPDADVFESGIYYLASISLNSWYLQGALRYDYRQVTADASAAYLIADDFILPGNPENRKLTREFGGFTGSLGATKTFNKQQQLKLNFSTGFRAPDLAELFSNGPHPGTNRFEKGNDTFGREQSYQVDASYSFRKNKFQANVSVFGSMVENYIFFTASLEQTPENNQEIWSYRQTNTGFYGLEFDAKYNWLNENRLETSVSGAIVRAKDLHTNKNLSFIPPDNFNLEATYYALSDKSLSIFSRLRIIKDQDKVGLTEEKTPGYSLLNFGANKKFSFGKNSLDAGFTIHNALDKTYVDHMSLLRAFEVSSPGRNIMLNLKYNF